MWDVAKSLDVLLWQVNTMAPGRSKVSDGSIGDNQPGHQTPKSEHYPEDKPGNEPDEVDARDFTHDPRAGADMGKIAEQLRLSRDWRIKYVIWHQSMFSSYPMAGYPAWTWRPYSGDYHSHLHVSVNDVDDDNTALWAIGPWAAPQEDEEMNKPILVNLSGRATVWVKEPDRKLRALGSPWQFDAFKAMGAIALSPAPTAEDIVAVLGLVDGADYTGSVAGIKKAG